MHDLEQIIFCCNEFYRLDWIRDGLIGVIPREENPELDRVARTVEALHDRLCIRVRGLMTNSRRNDGKSTSIDPLSIGDIAAFKKAREWASQDIAHTNFKNRAVHEIEKGAGFKMGYLYPGDLRQIRNACTEKLETIRNSDWGESKF